MCVMCMFPYSFNIIYLIVNQEISQQYFICLYIYFFTKIKFCKGIPGSRAKFVQVEFSEITASQEVVSLFGY